jgi:hypothetical protein
MMCPAKGLEFAPPEPCGVAVVIFDVVHDASWNGVTFGFAHCAQWMHHEMEAPTLAPA